MGVRASLYLSVLQTIFATLYRAVLKGLQFQHYFRPCGGFLESFDRCDAVSGDANVVRHV